MIFVHGGLQTLAIPIQAILIALPILAIEYLPSGMFKEGATLELVSLVYLASLWVGMRLQVAYSDKLVVPATYMRRFLGRTAQLSWVLPVIVYWFVARTILGFLLSAMGIDLTDQTIEFDILILEEILPMDQNESGTPLVDLIVAMGVLPIATFTTISVLAGGYDIPEWMDPSKMVGNIRDGMLPERKSRGVYSGGLEFLNLSTTVLTLSMPRSISCAEMVYANLRWPSPEAPNAEPGLQRTPSLSISMANCSLLSPGVSNLGNT